MQAFFNDRLHLSHRFSGMMTLFALPRIRSNACLKFYIILYGFYGPVRCGVVPTSGMGPLAMKKVFIICS